MLWRRSSLLVTIARPHLGTFWRRIAIHGALRIRLWQTLGQEIRTPERVAVCTQEPVVACTPEQEGGRTRGRAEAAIPARAEVYQRDLGADYPQVLVEGCTRVREEGSTLVPGEVSTRGRAVGFTQERVGASIRARVRIPIEATGLPEKTLLNTWSESADGTSLGSFATRGVCDVAS